MTKENIFKSYLEDPLLIEKNYITKEKGEKMKFFEQSGVKIIEVIKMAINGNVDGEPIGTVTNKIVKYLNK